MAVRQITICDREGCNVEENVESFSVRRTGGPKAAKLDLCTEHSAEIRAVLDAEPEPAAEATPAKKTAKAATAK